ncbi:hypothetical protein [Streptomyces sp. NBC_00280]|uniref:hypothetical protein n=1 Tax=Streptomyces sp. NBC_00280 TaxID=2975699 RepID=UPI003245F340
MVQTLAAGGELQGGLQRKLTYDGLRAAEAEGNRGGRRPAVVAGKVGAVRTAHLEGRSIAALARDHDVSRGAIRTAVAALLPEYTAAAPDAPAPELPVALDIPGKVADFLRAADLQPAGRATLDQGVTVRRCQGATLRVTAAPAIHCRLLDGSPGTSAVPAQGKARHEHENRVSTLAGDTPSRAVRAPRSPRGGFRTVRSQKIWIEEVSLTWALSVLLGRIRSRAAQWICTVLRPLERELRRSHLFCRTARPWPGVFSVLVGLIP